jgi:hypothetical protein
MTSKEFVIWLKGFTEGVHEFNVTPKQWDYLKEKLEQVSDEERIGTPIGIGGFGTVNVTPGTTGILNIPNPNTSTTYMNPQSGSWHYTNS